MARTTRRNLTFPDALWDAMEARAIRSHRSTSGEIRAACAAWLEMPAQREIDALNLRPTAERYIAALPTLAVGHFDDLKIDDGTARVWLSRLTTADGAEVDYAVTAERLEGRTWVPANRDDVYRAIERHKAKQAGGVKR